MGKAIFDLKDTIIWYAQELASPLLKEKKCENCPLAFEVEYWTDCGMEYDVFYLCDKAENYKKDYCFTPLFIRKMQYKNRKAKQDKLEENYWNSMSDIHMENK